MKIMTRLGGSTVHGLQQAGGVLVGAGILFGAVSPMASATPAALSSEPETVVSAPAAGSVVVVDGKFTPAQQAALKAVLDSPAGRAQVAQALGPVSAVKPGTIGTRVEGGKDGDHWWIKISMAEIAGVGISAACKAAFPHVGWFVCPPLGAAVQQAVDQWPNAGGVWAELYTDGRIRIGTW